MMFLDCPAYLDDEGGARCGLPAEIGCRYTMESTDGPLDSVMIKCPSGHRFNGPVEFLTWGSPHLQKPVRARCDSPLTSHEAQASGATFACTWQRIGDKLILEGNNSSLEPVYAPFYFVSNVASEI
jgi:hypothetical protein